MAAGVRERPACPDVEKIKGRTAGGLKKPFTRPERQWPHRSGSIRMWTGGTVKSRARALRCVPMLSPSGRGDNLAVDTREGGDRHKAS
jgi:hypothetical protein